MEWWSQLQVSHKHWFGLVWNYFTTLFWITKSTSPTFDSQDGNEEGLKILGHFSVPPTSCHTKTINKNTASLILFDIEYCLHPNVRRKSIVHLKLVQYSLILGSPVSCSSDSWFLTEATVGWTYQSYCRAMHFQGNEGKWNQLKIRDEQESSPLLRKGVVGGWKSYFTPELNERFEKEVLAKLKTTPSELVFDFEI